MIFYIEYEWSGEIGYTEYRAENEEKAKEMFYYARPSAIIRKILNNLLTIDCLCCKIKE